ncbi:BrnT family toxin [Teredinibacter turnerae]|uniref:BrnT family toxin n=1 Tax=Teredinibacter turnerae TaxID=2426 RepID=UPI00037DBAC1|nr:BrnT family toxin [Teredinibacter turnerae]
MEFEWDENKRQETLLRRGIDFLDAVLIWDDPFRQERVDNRNNYGEVRYQTIGKCALGVLFIAYTVRVYSEGKMVNRIISVRPAKKKDIEQYESRTFSKGLAI